MMMRKIFFALLLAMSSVAAQADQALQSKALLDACRTDPEAVITAQRQGMGGTQDVINATAKDKFCIGYLTAVLESLSHFEKAGVLCPPPQLTMQDMRRDVTERLQSHSDSSKSGETSRYAIARQALIEKYPCDAQ